MRTATARGQGILLIAWLLPCAGSFGQGEQIGSPTVHISASNRAIEAARARVTLTSEQLQTAGSLLAARTALAHACQAAHDAVDRVREDAQRSETAARVNVAEAHQAVQLATAAVESARAALVQTENRSLDRHLVAYDIAQHGRLTVNVLTGSSDLTLESGPGIAWRLGDLDALVAGRYPHPRLEPLTAAAETSSLRHIVHTNYTAVRRDLDSTFGAGNVYLLSRRLLDWASADRFTESPPRTARVVAWSTEGDRAEAKRLLQLEFEDFAMWLRLKGVDHLELATPAILADLIRSGSSPRLGLLAKHRSIDYTHRFEPAGVTEISSQVLASASRRTPARSTVPWESTEKRTAVAVVWNGPAPASRPLGSLLGSGFKSPAIPLDDLRKLMPTTADRTIRRLVEWTSGGGITPIDADGGQRLAVRTALGPRADDLKDAAATTGSIVDLRSTGIAEITSLYLGRLAAGNSGFTNLESLELDQTSGRLEAEFTIHHRHGWANRRETQAELGSLASSLSARIRDQSGRPGDTAEGASRNQLAAAESRARDASAMARDAESRLVHASQRLAAKRTELAALAAELARARADLKAAANREATARIEAKSARDDLNQIEATASLAGRSDNRQDLSSARNPIVYSGREPTIKR
jgi:hypothetical protein